ncbi:hypothetical protein [Streptococcus acidominimus]|uniref:Uncharacterized protein n=1 Tax=Streptococcus acidominimus TaxID=1326 RepID=A0A4Y9FRL4_STRAI|nr:hypothetical protein [Streptococcus acidominimus]MBF0817862.1 hypothetical protein [Streptococcus acidominimus]MBF0838378.1 hypothetical protein [Streptococcus acidominimus]MBF0846259.1 hypothetical protein [Streptococcus danieliae]TFU31851.1 hypothetical protein E4U01_00070 [Streptococcus acidominimus]
MADLQKLPVQAKEVFGEQVYVTPTVDERVPTGRMIFEPYRVFKVSGEKQQDVSVRVVGLANSEIPKRLSRVEFTGLEMSVSSIQSRGKTKREVTFIAKSMKVVK